MSSHHGEIRVAGKISPATVSKIREILQANPGMALRRSVGPDGQSSFALVARSRTARQRQLAALKARAKVVPRGIDEALEHERKLARLKERAARSQRLLGF